MPISSRPSQILQVASLREGRVSVEYEVYTESSQPNRLEFRRGQRYLLELFDGGGNLAQTLPALLDLALDMLRGLPTADDISGTEKLLSFFYGQSIQWAGEMPAHCPKGRNLSLGLASTPNAKRPGASSA